MTEDNHNDSPLVPADSRNLSTPNRLLKRGIGEIARYRDLEEFTCSYCEYKIKLERSVIRLGTWTSCPNCGIPLPLTRDSSVYAICRACNSKNPLDLKPDTIVAGASIAKSTNCPMCREENIRIVLVKGGNTNQEKNILQTLTFVYFEADPDFYVATSKRGES